jgi:hypothetical protein
MARAFGGIGIGEDFRITLRGDGTPLTEREVEGVNRAYAKSAFVSFTGLDDDSRERIGFTVSEPTEIEIYAIGEVTGGEAYDYGWLMNTETGEVLWKLGAEGSAHAGGGEKNRMARTIVSLDPGSYAAFAVTDGSHDASDWNTAPPLDPEYWGLTIRTAGEGPEVEVYAYQPAPLANAFVSMIGVGDDEVRAERFTLARPTAIRIVAMGEGSGGDMFDYGWILDAETHQPVWTMEYEDTEQAGGSDKNRLADLIVSLEAGSYVVYYISDGSHSFEDWNTSPPLDQDRWGITLVPASGTVSDGIVTTSQHGSASEPGAMASLIGIGDSESRSESFTLERETEIRIYALGEGSGGDMYDFAWIEDAGTGTTVWQMRHGDTEHGGGASKNRVFHGTITLPAGDYSLRYESDGSHSLEDWNSAAPYDPLSYGVTIYRNR